MENLKNINLYRRHFFGNIEVKIIFDLLIKLYKLKKFKALLFFLNGVSENGKTISLYTLSFSIGNYIPFMFSNGSLIESFKTKTIHILNYMARKSIGIKFYQENFIIGGTFCDLKVKNNKESSVPISARITIKNASSEKTYDISEGLLKKIFLKKIKLGEELLINRTTGDVYQNYFKIKWNNKKKKLSNTSIERIVITEQLVTLYELDNINQKGNILNTYFSKQFTKYNFKINETLDDILLKWVKNNKIKLIKGFLVIDDVTLINEKNFTFIKDLLLKFTCPLILCIGSSSYNHRDFSVFSSKRTLSLNYIEKSVISLFKPNNCRELIEIIRHKCLEYKVKTSKESINLLVKIGLECGSKYSLYILSVSSILNKKNFFQQIDVKKSCKLFLDHQKSIFFTKNQHFKIFYTK